MWSPEKYYINAEETKVVEKMYTSHLILLKTEFPYTVFRTTECGFTDFFKNIIKKKNNVRFEVLTAVSSDIIILCDMTL
jgi:hypothetical protein